MAGSALCLTLGAWGCTSPSAPQAQPPADAATGERQVPGGQEPFAGEIAGVTFKPEVTAEDFGCEPDEAVHEVPAETVSSPLVFSAVFLEPAFALTWGDTVSVCGDRPISFAVEAHTEGKRVHIHRRAAKP